MATYLELKGDTFISRDAEEWAEEKMRTEGFYWVKFVYLPEDPPEVVLWRDGLWWFAGEGKHGYTDDWCEVLSGPLTAPA